MRTFIQRRWTLIVIAILLADLVLLYLWTHGHSFTRTLDLPNR